MSQNTKTTINTGNEIVSVTVVEKEGFWGNYKEATVVDRHGHKATDWGRGENAEAVAISDAIKKLPCNSR